MADMGAISQGGKLRREGATRESRIGQFHWHDRHYQGTLLGNSRSANLKNHGAVMSLLEMPGMLHRTVFGVREKRL
jgi:hypothetical protein